MGKSKKWSQPQQKSGQSLTSESTRLWASNVIESFRRSGKDVHVFDYELSNAERQVIHEMCRRNGMGSKSKGSGNQRRLSIFKGDAHKGEEKGDAASLKEKLEYVSFPSEAKPVLQELFTRYPPCDADATESSLSLYTGHNRKSKMRDDFFCKPLLNKKDILEKAASLSSRLANDKGFREIFTSRTKLPIASFRDVITSAVESNQVILIAGETGCGKTTQVPQYILDHMWYSKREACKIICAQPRRISAISVSERISWERGETIGNNVGYKVRLQTEGGRQSSIVFCTNGIILRVLAGKGIGGLLPDITHIIVDEIHERDCFSDFMLAILRDMLPLNPHLRLILMSATLDAEKFSGYFGGCPVVRVPGFTYPVKTFYLEDALSVLQSGKNDHPDSEIPDGKRDLKDEDKVALDEAINLAWTNNEFDALLDLVSSEGSHEVYDYQQSSTWLTPLMVFAGKGRLSDVSKLLSFGADCKLKSKEGMTALELAEKENQFEAAQIIREHVDNLKSNSQQAQDLLDKYMESTNPECVDVGLIVRLMQKICSFSEVGAVLVFLPGWEEISKTQQKLLENPFFKDSAKFSILCLHSKVPAHEQKKVFDRPPRGCRKIVLATNIAESAVTIDDVVYVIDSGRMKEKSYDPYNDVATLQSSWVSKANAKQRQGRAGRCQPGICYHLYSKLRATSLPEFRVPEVMRMPVDELCLQVKVLDPSCNVNDFLQKLMDPPVAQSIANALIILKNIGALTPQEELTELGQKFGQLPVHPRISKMLYFAILVNCLDPALILACAAESRDLFIMPMSADERKKADAAKLKLASLYGGHSDHLATVAAFYCWKNANRSGQSNAFCSEYFISRNAMKMLDSMCVKLHGELQRHGLIPSNDSNCSLNAHDRGILHAVVTVGFYPMVGRVCPPSMDNRRGFSVIVETITGTKVRVLSLSRKCVMSATEYDEALIVFDEITQGDRGIHIRHCTALHTIPLLLFSGEIAVAPTDSCDTVKSDDEEDHKVENVGDVMDIDKVRPGEKIMLAPENTVKLVVDRWLPFEMTAFEVSQMYILRERLMASILFMVKRPQEKLPAHLGASMYAIACILSYGGLVQPSVPTEAVKPIASVVDATSLRDDIPSANANGCQEHAPNATPLGSKLESANNSSLGDMADGNEQPDPNTALMEGVSTTKQQDKKLSVNNLDLGNMEEIASSDLANGSEQTEPKSVNNLDLGNMEEISPSDLANGNEQTEHKSVNNLDLGNMEENSTPSDLTNGNEQTEVKSANESDFGNMEENNTPSDLTSGNEQTEVKSDLGNMEESLPSSLAHGDEQPDPNIVPIEAVSAAKQPKKKQPRPKRRKLANKSDVGIMEENNTPCNLSNGNEQTELESANKSDLGNMEDSLPSSLAYGDEQPDPNIVPIEAVSAAKQPKKKQPRPKRRKLANKSDVGIMEENNMPCNLSNGNEQTGLESANKSDLGNMEESLPSSLAHGDEQRDPNIVPIEAVSAAKQPRPKRRKLANKSDVGIMEENNTPCNLSNGNEQTELESTNKSDLGNMEESLPSSLAHGDEQPDPNIVPIEAVSAAKQPRPERRKLAIKSDVGIMEENNMPCNLSNGNEQTELESANKSDLGNMEESLPSSLVHGDEQPDPNIIPIEAVSAAKQPKKQRKPRWPKWRKLANKLDVRNMEENTPCNLSNGNEQTEFELAKKSDLGDMEESLPSNFASADQQPDPNTVPIEAVSAGKQPEKKRSKSKRHKSANNLDSGNNMEENMPSTNGTAQHDLDSVLADTASMAMAKQQNNEVQTEPKIGNRSDLIKEKESLPSDHVKGNEQSDDPSTAPAEAVSMEIN